MRSTSTRGSQIPSEQSLQETLSDLAKENADVLLSFAYEELWGGEKESGHVCIFDKIVGDNVWMIDPEQEVPKFRKATIQNFYRAIRKHDIDAFNGLFLLEDKD